MKFRGRMMDFVAMRDFTNVVSTISRMAKECVLRVTPDQLCFHLGEDRTSAVSVEMAQKHFFTEYVMTGLSEEENVIYLEFDSSMVSRCINSLRMSAKSVKIKLTNKRQPCLTFEIELPSLSLESRHCVHDVPVRVIPRREWSEFRISKIKEFDVTLDMPQLKHIRNIVDRMKNMGPQLTLTADKTGRFVLKISTDSANVETHFQGRLSWENSQTNENNAASATIDIKKFSTFLAWDIIHPDSVKCNILQGKMVNLSLSKVDYLNINHFVPAVVF